MVSWFGLFAPAGTPPELASFVDAETAKFGQIIEQAKIKEE